MKLSITNIATAMSLVAAFAVTAIAQGNGSDGSGVGGAGGGFTGSLGIGTPRANGGGNEGDRGAGGVTGQVTNEANTFNNTGAGGITVTNPATGTRATVPQNVAKALGAALHGNGAGAATLTSGLTAGGALPSGPANALVTALMALGSNPSFGNVVNAISAYNAAVNALTGPVPPALLAVRAALSGFSH